MFLKKFDLDLLGKELTFQAIQYGKYAFLLEQFYKNKRLKYGQ